ncbi:uncharacterized protein PgNI_08037 [Pyricularia grisea]|uniref:Aquaporin-like protein n=1 Tax=Pyricularia grisea TaxID=148305 RepID=A0A6P8AVU3_PYRGI|nr:uncharacterized protein PgNI_08037 [Pyricularia grisea]TLD06348.1 hypothetical protein PgNI_08037 [Pyricularia grisea]
MDDTASQRHKDTMAHHGHGHSAPRRQSLRHHLVAALGEFVGTFLFLFFGYASHSMIATAERPTPEGLRDGYSAQATVLIALAYAMAILVTVWAMYRISGGLFNPAITLGLGLAGQLPWIRIAVLFPTQLVASMCAGGVVEAMLPGPISRVNTKLATDVSVVQGVFLEMFFTAYLLFVVLMVAAEKSKDTFIAPVAIGLAAFVALIPGAYYTGASLNPARSFGCAVAGLEFPEHHWIYWVGPFLGSALGAGFYRLLKFLNYEEANPGQDSDYPLYIERV